jgi:fatty acid desaturase
MIPDAQTRPFPWTMCIVPLLEGLFFILAGTTSNLLLSLVFLTLAGLFLSYSIHIFFHECVHTRGRFPTAFNLLGSIFLGLPFDGYRVHHYNHHTHDNRAEDFSTTWRYGEDGKAPVGFTALSYSLGWPRQLVRAMKEPNPFSQDYGDPLQIKSRIPPQKLTIGLFFILLLIVDWHSALHYVALIYIGWAFSAMHNFGQHPPIEGRPIGSYPGRLYNRLTFNNGLHGEHHRHPSLAWHELEPESDSYDIGCAHFLYPIYHRSMT